MSANPRATAKIAGHPLHPLLVTIPVGLLVGAFLTDVAYCWTGWAGYANFSSWLIGAGIVTALIAAVAGFIDFFGERRIRDLRIAWVHMVGNLVVVAISVANFFVHLRDGAAGVLPTGIWLSGLVVLLLVVTGWLGGEMVFRHRVAVLEEERERP